MHRGKVDPGVSELPRSNDLSRDHVNRPLSQSEVKLQSVQVSEGFELNGSRDVEVSFKVQLYFHFSVEFFRRERITAVLFSD